MPDDPVSSSEQPVNPQPPPGLPAVAVHPVVHAARVARDEVVAAHVHLVPPARLDALGCARELQGARRLARLAQQPQRTRGPRRRRPRRRPSATRAVALSGRCSSRASAVYTRAAPSRAASSSTSSSMPPPTPGPPAAGMGVAPPSPAASSRSDPERSICASRAASSSSRTTGAASTVRSSRAPSVRARCAASFDGAARRSRTAVGSTWRWRKVRRSSPTPRSAPRRNPPSAPSSRRSRKASAPVDAASSGRSAPSWKVGGTVMGVCGSGNRASSRYSASESSRPKRRATAVGGSASSSPTRFTPERRRPASVRSSSPSGASGSDASRWRSPSTLRSDTSSPALASRRAPNGVGAVATTTDSPSAAAEARRRDTNASMPPNRCRLPPDSISTVSGGYGTTMDECPSAASARSSRCAVCAASS